MGRNIPSGVRAGDIALHFAARIGILKTVEILVREGLSPLCMAIKTGNKEILHLLLEKEPPATLYGDFKDAYGGTPLHWAAQRGDLDALGILLSISRATFFDKDNGGYFPIHMASETGNVKVIKELVECWPYPEELLTKEGRNILHVAAMKGKDNNITEAALSETGCQRNIVSETHKEKRIASMPPNPTKIQWIKDQVGALLTAGTLAATGTFTAGFALRGGYNSPENNPDKGTATMINKHVFQLFMICNTASFYGSIICILCCFYALLGDVYVAAKAFNNGQRLFGVALSMMSLAGVHGCITYSSRQTSLACLSPSHHGNHRSYYDYEPPANLSEQSSSENKNEKSKDMDKSETTKQVGIEE
ncbi:uncharacterized protein LOC110668203 [Hevea brasiliensis]|uniref:uncharacterized protein LOC110668203 n=1 Tax=Hevea brasiliensis TaxID=3981 RepID=UPI0025D2053D|nr:uncharacterized protein LOC110668203 [Hevea brasiliensis]